MNSFLSFALDSRLRKDGRRQIKLRIAVNGTTTSVPTSCWIYEHDYIPKSMMPIRPNYQCREYREYIDKLLAMYDLYSKLIDSLAKTHKLNKTTAPEIYAMVNDSKKHSIPVFNTFTSVMREYTNNCRSEKTRQTYMYADVRLHHYAKKCELQFDEIDYRFLNAFNNDMEERGMKMNSRSIVFRCMRAVWNYAENINVVDRGMSPFKCFKIENEQRDKEYLKVDMFRKLVNVELSGREELARDFFLLQFFLCGVDTTDLYDMNVPSDGEVVFTRNKMQRRKPITLHIKLQDEALPIVKKYKGKKHLLFLSEYFHGYTMWRCNAAQDLKSVGKKIGCPWIHFRLARYTWATYAAKVGVPEMIIDAALGHKPTTVLRKCYATIDWDQVDDANRKVIDYAFGIKREDIDSITDIEKLRTMLKAALAV